MLEEVWRREGVIASDCERRQRMGLKSANKGIVTSPVLSVFLITNFFIFYVKLGNK